MVVSYCQAKKCRQVFFFYAGAEVAQYCAMHLPKYIKETESYMANNLGQGLIDAFLEFDSILIKENVIKELKELAGEDEDEDEEDGMFNLCKYINK